MATGRRWLTGLGIGAMVLAVGVFLAVTARGAAEPRGAGLSPGPSPPRPLASPTAAPRFQVGVNIPDVMHYGYAALVPRSTPGEAEADLQALQGMGATIVRLYAADDGISDQETARRLGIFLDAAQRHNISVIVSLVNYYGSHQNPPGMAPDYALTWQGIPYLSHAFFASDYRGAYLRFVRTVVTANRGHPNIYAWEPGNELADSDKPAFLAFMRQTTDLLKTLDPRHAVATGMIQAAQAGFTPAELYGSLPSVDIVTVHPGNGYRGSVIDVDWAVAHGKRAIVEETGISATDNRAARFETELRYWRGQGASAFLLDGFIAKGLPDDGSGDKQLGFDAIWHTDYDQVAAMLRRAARA